MRESIHFQRICLCGLALGLLGSAGCSKSEPAARGSSGAAAATTVSVVSPKERALRRVVEEPGTIQGYEETKLFARVPGQVRLLHDRDGRIVFDIGRTIRGPRWYSRGEVLAELVVPELVETTKLKWATVQQRKAEVDQAEKLLAAAVANIAVADAAKIEAQAKYDRWESQLKVVTDLVMGKALDPQSRTETEAAYKEAGGKLASAKAMIDKAKADRDRAESDVAAAKSRVEVATADALQEEAMLGYSKIRAPYDGIVTRRRVNTDDFVQPAGGQDNWLFTVAKLDPVRVVIDVPETDAELVADGMEVKITVQALAGPTLTGKVARTSWSLEPAARTLRTEIELQNKDGRLRPGNYVYAQFVKQLAKGWTLETAAVTKQGNATVCFLIEGDKAVRTPVQIGRSDGQYVEVFKRQKAGSPGVWENFIGDEKVAARASGLTDGQQVQLETLGK
jgi:RND family efflux transporter MFP subunit